RGDLYTCIEIDNVLPAGCGMPIEVVGRRDLAKDDAGRRQALGQLSRARLFDPLDLDVPEMGLAVRISVEIVYPHQLRLLRKLASVGILAGEQSSTPASPGYTCCGTCLWRMAADRERGFSRSIGRSTRCHDTKASTEAVGSPIKNTCHHS